jgi:hypothetical protein
VILLVGGVCRTGVRDTSRPFRFNGADRDTYDHRCSCCFLGHTHSIDAHNASMREACTYPGNPEATAKALAAVEWAS